MHEQCAKKIITVLRLYLPLYGKSDRTASRSGFLSTAFSKTSASAEKRNTRGMLTSSVPSPDMANIGELLADVPGVLSSTMPPTAPRASNLRACNKSMHNPSKPQYYLLLVWLVYHQQQFSHKWLLISIIN